MRAFHLHAAVREVCNSLEEKRERERERATEARRHLSSPIHFRAQDAVAHTLPYSSTTPRRFFFFLSFVPDPFIVSLHSTSPHLTPPPLWCCTTPLDFSPWLDSLNTSHATVTLHPRRAVMCCAHGSKSTDTIHSNPLSTPSICPRRETTE